MTDSASTQTQIQKRLLSIDSRDRDLQRDSSASSYTWPLPSSVNQVVGFELVSCEFPVDGETTVTSRNNKFDIEYNSVDYVITLTEGNYSITSLVTHLKNQLDTATSATWTVTVTSGRRLTLSNPTAAFTIKMKTGASAADTQVSAANGGFAYMNWSAVSARHLLGFSWADHASTGGGPYTVTTDQSYFGTTEPLMLRLKWNGQELHNSINVRDQSSVAFLLPRVQNEAAIVTTQNLSENRYVFGTSLNRGKSYRDGGGPFYVQLEQKVRRLRDLKITLETTRGQLVECGGLQHHFVLAVYFEQQTI